MKLRTLALALAVTAACGKSKKSEPSSSSGSGEASGSAAAPAKKALAADFFGKVVAPPGLMAKVPFGATEADAKKAAPEIFVKAGKSFQLVDDPAIDGVSYGVGLDKDTGKVDQLELTIPATAQAMIATAWGAGKDAKDTLGKPQTVWLDPAGGWRAILAPGFDPKELKLTFHPYLPAQKLFGDGADALGFAPQGILGATIAELRTRFPGVLVEESAAQAADEQKKIGNLAGSDVADKMGPAQPSVRLALPPTEWEEFETRVQIDWGDDGKVADVWFDVPYAAYAPAKDELLALIKKKWGDAKDGTYLGEKAMMFRDQPPFVAVVDDTIGHAWSVHVLAKKPE